MSTVKTYIIGFILSILLTIAAPGLLILHASTEHAFPSHEGLMVGFIILALLQLVVQLVFFLHVGKDKKVEWNVVALALALIMVVILVGGTLWVMENLTHHQMLEQPDVFIEENIFPHTSHTQ